MDDMKLTSLYSSDNFFPAALALMRCSPCSGDEVSQFLSKLAQLHGLIEEFDSELQNIAFQKEYLLSLQERELEKLRLDFMQTQGDIVEGIRSKTDTVSTNYKRKYRKILRSLTEDLEKHFSERQSALQTTIETSSEVVNDMILASKQIRHTVETAGNALNAQTKLTMRDIAKSVKSSREIFAENIKKCDSELQVKIEKLNSENQKKLTEIERQGNAAKAKATKQLATEKSKPKHCNDRNTLDSLRNSIPAMRESVNSLVQSHRSRFQDIREELGDLRQTMSKYCIKSTLTELGNELARKIEELKKQNSQVIKEKRVKVGNLELIRDMDKREYKRCFDQKKQELDEVMLNAKESLAELERVQSEALDELRCRIKSENYRVDEQLSNTESELIKLREKCDNEKRVLIEEAEKERSRLMLELKSLYENERIELEKANRIEVSDVKMKLESRISKLQGEAEMRRDELAQYQSELEKISSVCFDEETCPSIDYSDVDELQTNQEREYNEMSEKKAFEIDKHKKRMDMELARLKRKLDANYEAQMGGVEKEMSGNCKEYIDLDDKYREEYEKEELKLAKITPVNPNDDEFLSKARRLIENLTHQSYQLKSTLKFQRVAIESEWQMKIDAENANHDEQSLEFAQKHRALQELFNLQQKVADEKYKYQQEITELNNELSSLELQNSEIWTLFERDKEQAMREEQYDQWTQILSSVNDETSSVLSNALAECEAEKSSLKSLINEYEKQTKIEMDNMRRFLENSSTEVNEFGLKLRGALSDVIGDVKQEALREVSSHQESLKKMKYQFEAVICDLESKIRTLTKEKKDQEARMFNEYNTQKSSNNMRVEDLSRANRAVLEEAKRERRSVTDFFDEKISVLIKARNFFQESYVNRGLRPIEQERISALEKQLRSISKNLGSATLDFSNVKRMMSVRERVYNHNFGKKPKVGTLTRRSYT